MFESRSKDGWPRVAFGDVVRLSRERSNDPEGDGFRRYVGLDHLEQGELTIRRWGDVSEGTTFANVFHAGQVLFGKRRAYQRKVALPHFDGVCSGDIYVFEAKSERLLPELLPFVCQTEGFFGHAVGTSAGSLSPRTNWESLSTYEFTLPPIDEQRAMLRVLAPLGDALRAVRALSHSVRSLVRASTNSMLGLPLRSPTAHDAVSSPFELRCLEDVVSKTRAISYGILKPGDVERDGIPMLRVMDFDDFGRRTPTEVAWVSKTVADTSPTTYLSSGDVLVSVMATIGRCFLVRDAMTGWNVNRALAVLPFDDNETGEFVEACLQARYMQEVLQLAKIGSAQPRINLEFLKRLRIPFPPKEVRDAVVRVRWSLDQALTEGERRARDIQHVKSCILNGAFDS